MENSCSLVRNALECHGFLLAVAVVAVRHRAQGGRQLFIWYVASIISTKLGTILVLSELEDFGAHRCLVCLCASNMATKRSQLIQFEVHSQQDVQIALKCCGIKGILLPCYSRITHILFGPGRVLSLSHFGWFKDCVMARRLNGHFHSMLQVCDSGHSIFAKKCIACRPIIIIFLSL